MANGYDQLDDWQKAERLEGMAKTITVKGARHHADIADVLCSRCEHGMVYRQRNGNGAIRVICNLGSAPLAVPHDIDECSKFDQKASVEITLDDMAKIALTIDPRQGPPSKNVYL